MTFRDLRTIKASEREAIFDNAPIGYDTPEISETGLEALKEAVNNNMPDEYSLIDSDVAYGCDLYLNYVDTRELTRTGYKKYDNFISKAEFDTPNLVIYCSDDGSGYDYWTGRDESNYCHVTIQFKSADPEKQVITQEDKDGIWDVLNEIERRYDNIRANYQSKRQMKRFDKGELV